MTAPEQPICGPACDPTKCMPGCALQPDHAHKPSEQANEQALRDRIAEALNHAFAYVTASGRGTTTGFVAWTDFADAVMAVVQPVLDAKDAEIAQQATDADRLDQLLIDERAITARLGRELAALRAQQDGNQT